MNLDSWTLDLPRLLFLFTFTKIISIVIIINDICYNVNEYVNIVN